MKTYEGIIHGQSIELTEPIDLQEGSRVEVEVRPAKPISTKWGDGLIRCMGILADSWTEEDDRILEELAQDRHRSYHRDLDLDDPE